MICLSIIGITIPTKNTSLICNIYAHSFQECYAQAQKEDKPVAVVEALSVPEDLDVAEDRSSDVKVEYVETDLDTGDDQVALESQHADERADLAIVPVPAGYDPDRIDTLGAPQASAQTAAEDRQDQYGAPADDGYGSPQAPVEDGYGSPQAPPVSDDGYGAPQAPPLGGYEGPQGPVPVPLPLPVKPGSIVIPEGPQYGPPNPQYRPRPPPPMRPAYRPPPPKSPPPPKRPARNGL